MLDTPYANGEAALASQVAEAHAARTPLRILGGGTRSSLGKPVAGETVAAMALSGISLYEPGALTIVAGAGTPLAEIEAALTAENQRLPFEPMDHRGLFSTKGTPTIGAVAVGNISGPRRIQAGACRDAMLGVRFIDGRGEVIANGGRVMKNVTGYDLVKLMAGSWGTLGVLTEVALKVQPAPEATATLAISGVDDTTAIAALSAALGSPYDVNGAACMAGKALVRVEGFAAQIAHRVPALTKALAHFGAAEVIEGADSDALWRDVRDVAPFHGAGDNADEAVWRVSLKPTDGPKLVEALRGHGALEAMYDWGGGLVWIRLPDVGDALAEAIRAETKRLGGHATLIRASDATRAAVPVFEPEAAPVAALSTRIRRQFDPAGILNAGLMG